MFVAYTGYGRIATLGEEVRQPRQTIPRAIVLTLLISASLYVAVAAVAIGVAGAPALAKATRDTAAPLEHVASLIDQPGLRPLVALCAMTAMLGVLLNLVLGLSRVVLAMGRRGDMPASLARVTPHTASPQAAVVAVGALIALLACAGSIRLAWSFSALTVLVYYAITNLAALKLPSQDRMYHKAFAWAGLLACVFLAYWVDAVAWCLGSAWLAAGLLWHCIRQAACAKA